MPETFERRRELRQDTGKARASRGFGTPFPDVPGGKIHGDTARGEGKRTSEALLCRPFNSPSHPETHRVDAEGAWGRELGVSYPAAGTDTPVVAPPFRRGMVRRPKAA